MSDAAADNDTATWHLPVAIFSASAAALATMALAGLAAVLEMSRPILIVTSVTAVIGGCGVLAALVVHSNRRTAERTREVIIDAMNARIDPLDETVCDLAASVVRLHEAGAKNAKSVRSIATELAVCKAKITSEVEKVRATLYTLHAESDAATGTSGRRRFGVVDN